MKTIIRFIQLSTLWALVMFAVGEQPVSGSESCASSYEECATCCDYVFNCCVLGGGKPISDCEYDPPSCSLPGCFGGPPCDPPAPSQH